MRRNQLSGSVSARSGDAVGGLLIEAWSLSDRDAPIASSLITDEGAFTLTFDEKDLTEGRLNFRFFAGTELLASVEHQPEGEEPVAFELASAPADKPRGPVHAVRGRVRGADGLPVVGARVRAFDRELRREQPLGSAVTDAAGRYEIRYPARLGKGKRAADLMLRAYGAGDAAVGESAVRFAAPAFARIDLELPAGVRPGVSTFAHIEAATLPLLEGAPADEIAAGDLAFLSGKTGIPEDQLADFARAHKLAAACGVPAAACFAALRHGLPGDLNGLLSLPKADLDAALAAALATGLVPGALEGEASGIVNKLIKLRTSHPLRKAAGDEVTFGALLNAAGVSRSVQETFVRLVSLHAGPTEHLWRKVEVHPDGGKQAVADLGFALQAAALARGNLPLVEHLYAEKRSGRVRSLRDLAGLEPVEWRRRLDEVGAATPTDVPGVEDDDKRRNAFAQWISEALEAGFPTAALARRLSRDSELVNSPAAKFLAEHPDFDLGRERPRDVARDARTVTDLERLQRLFRLSPRYRHVRALLRCGFDSAVSIAGAGRQAFARALGGSLDAAEIERLYGAASRIALRSMALLTEGGAELSVAAIPDAAGEAIPELTALIGAHGFSACPECASVIGQAAYLGDLLGFLRDCRAAGGRSALDVLFTERRSDLGSLALGCGNTNSRLLKADLVIDLLEHAVSRETDPVRRAEAAAATLTGAAYPLVLPFDLARTRARVYLDHIGIARHEVMSTFQKRDHSAPTDMEIAAEELDLSPAELDVVTSGFRQLPSARAATRSPVMLRGLPVTDGVQLVAGDRVLVKHQENPHDDGVYTASARGWTKVPSAGGRGLIVEVDEGTSRGAWLQTAEGFVRLRAPGESDALPRQAWEYWGFADDGSITQANWPTPLADVETLEKRTGLPRAEVEELLAAAWVNPSETTFIEGNKVKNLTAPVAQRLLRFARLRRRTGFATGDLDRAIRALSPRELTDRFIAAAAQLRRLAAEVKLPVANLLSLYTDLSRPEYEKLFGDLGEAFALADGEPAGAGKPMSAHAPLLAPALGLTTEELALLIDPKAGEPLGLDAPVDDELSRSHLSRVVRRITLARAAGLTVQELLVLMALSRIAPFDGDHVDETRRLVALARKLRGLGISVAELDEALRGSPHEPGKDRALLESLKGAADDVIVDRLGAELKVDARIAQLLAHEGIQMPQRALEALREGEDDAPRVLRKLRRAALVVRGLRLEPELAWLIRRGPELGLLEFDTLPEERSPVEESAARFGAWERLVAFTDVRDALPARSPSLTEILDATLDVEPDNADGRRATFFAALAARTGWPVGEIEAVSSGLGLAFPKDFRDVRALARLVEAFALAARAGVPANKLLHWRGGALSLDDAAGIAAAVRERSGASRAGNLEAAVRTERRDALIAYLLHARGLPDAGALSGHLLVDVLSGEGVSVSPIEAATGSVQRFIQRCILGLEREINLSADDTRRWRWLHDFAAWQARRRAILQPENRLLDDLPERSPFFLELERELSLDHPEDAVRRYLEQLDAVARLEIAGLFLEDDVLHLVGRTSGLPRRHYYRRRAGGEWGPWEPVAADIDAETVMPVAWKGRVALLWPIAGDGTVRMAWSERQRGGFTPARTSTDAFPISGQVTRGNPGSPNRDASQSGDLVGVTFRTRFTAAGEPLVVVVEQPRPSTRRAGSPTLGAARVTRGKVAGAFRFSSRGPVAADAPSAEEVLSDPLPASGQLRLARSEGVDVLVLRKTGPRPRVTLPHRAGAHSPLAFDDGERSYLVTLLGAEDVPWGEPMKWMPGTVDIAMRQPWPGGGVPGGEQRIFPRPELGRYRFERLYHPTVGELLARLGRDGVDGVYAPLEVGADFNFQDYDPVPGTVDDDRPEERLSFVGGPYAQYNWELFFHVPLLIATRLTAARRFDEAQRWFHRVFDPTDPEKRFWKVPLATAGDVESWLRAPFDPHSIARARSGEYQRAVVMKYLDNLLAWGDELLAHKATGAAELLFRLAADVLGPPPKLPPQNADASAPSFNQLAESSTNVLVSIENLLPGETSARPARPGDGIEAVLALGRNLTVFCVPPNETMLRYWDEVAGRLQKVR